jgi:hypothetical protein
MIWYVSISSSSVPYVIKSFWDWRDRVIAEPTDTLRGACTVGLFERDNYITPIATFTFNNAWPLSVEISTLNAYENTRENGKRAVIERITLVHEGTFIFSFITHSDRRNCLQRR